MINSLCKLVCLSKLVKMTKNRKDASLQRNTSIFRKLRIRNVRSQKKASVFARLSYRVCQSHKTLAYNEICHFTINYDTVMFYSSCSWSYKDLRVILGFPSVVDSSFVGTRRVSGFLRNVQ